MTVRLWYCHTHPHMSVGLVLKPAARLDGINGRILVGIIVYTHRQSSFPGRLASAVRTLVFGSWNVALHIQWGCCLGLTFPLLRRGLPFIQFRSLNFYRNWIASYGDTSHTHQFLRRVLGRGQPCPPAKHGAGEAPVFSSTSGANRFNCFHFLGLTE